MPSLREPFQDRNFRLLFAANLLSGVGQGMTMIGAPWFLARMFPTAHVLGTIMIVTTAVNLVFSPYAGALIDRHRRRTLLLAENVAGALGLGAMALWGWLGTYNLAGIAAVYVFTVMIFNLHFPATFALVQEAFPRDWYGHISGHLEVLTQTAAIVAGGCAGLVFERWGLPAVFAIDSATYVVAFTLFVRFRHQATVGLARRTPAFRAEMREAVHYLRSRPAFTMVTVALWLPFVVLICLDAIHPFYVARDLHADASVFSLVNGCYAAGATAAGLWMRRVATHVGEHGAYVAAFTLFTLALLLLALVPQIGVALAAMLGVGWGNAGIRVSRVTYVMHTVPPPLIGRVNSFFNWVGLWTRGALLLFLTWSVDALGRRASYALCAAILAAAFALYRRHRDPPDGAVAALAGEAPIP